MYAKNVTDIAIALNHCYHYASDCDSGVPVTMCTTASIAV